MIRRSILRLLSCLLTVLRRQKQIEEAPVSPTSLRGLLPELILAIQEFLQDPADRLCLSLACKKFFNLNTVAEYQSLVRGLRKQGRNEDLLFRLERDLPGLMYCADSQRLASFRDGTRQRVELLFHRCTHYPRYMHWGVLSFSRRRSYVHPSLTYPPPTISFRMSNIPCMLEWSTAHLITNYSVLGPRHGVPASVLDCRTPTWPQDLMFGVRFSESWAGKVSPTTGELLICRTRRFFHAESMADFLRFYLDKRDIFICNHVARWLGQVKPHRRLRNPASVSRKSIAENEHVSAQGGCSDCDTDWEVYTGDRILGSHPKDGHGGGWTVLIRTYHNLGTCRSPVDPKWHTMAGHTFRGYRSGERIRGSVISLWNLACTAEYVEKEGREREDEI